MATLPLFNAPGSPSQARPDLRRPETRARLSQSAVDGFLAITGAAWQLSREQQSVLLGGLSRAMLHRLGIAAGTRSQDELTRISYIVGIYKALHILLPADLADRWISQPNDNPMFSGRPPVEYLAEHGIPGLEQVRSLLDAAVAGL